jgi:hypothetical protein
LIKWIVGSMERTFCHDDNNDGTSSIAEECLSGIWITRLSTCAYLTTSTALTEDLSIEILKLHRENDIEIYVVQSRYKLFKVQAKSSAYLRKIRCSSHKIIMLFNDRWHQTWNGMASGQIIRQC